MEISNDAVIVHIFESKTNNNKKQENIQIVINRK